MKAITLLLAAAGGAGFFFREPLQSRFQTLSHGIGDYAARHQAPEGVYYLRTAFKFSSAGVPIRWSPGQEVRTVAGGVAAHGFIVLTDGVNSSEVPQTAVTRDMDDAAALREVEASSQDAARWTAEHAAATQIQQAEAARRPYSTAGAPVFYPVYRTVVVNRAAQPNQAQRGSSTVIISPIQRIARPVSTPGPYPRK